MVSSERSGPDLSESTLFYIKKSFYLSMKKINFWVKKWKKLGLLAAFFELLPKSSPTLIFYTRNSPERHTDPSSPPLKVAKLRFWSQKMRNVLKRMQN